MGRRVNKENIGESDGEDCDCGTIALFQDLEEQIRISTKPHLKYNETRKQGTMITSKGLGKRQDGVDNPGRTAVPGEQGTWGRE